MTRRATLAATTACLVGLGLPTPSFAQQPAARPAAAAPASVPGPAVGDVAPDFALVGATRYGVLRDSIRLSDFRGKAVVLAFFYKARTKG